MKKIISVCLAVALAASMLCMNIFAAGTTSPETLPNLVGTYKGDKADNASVNDGWGSFEDKNASSDITLSLTTTSESRYAVDIEFKDTAKSFSANFVWNVNTHKYETKEDTSDTATITINPKLTITNHSDLSVYYKTAITAETVSGLTITPSGDTGSTVVAKSDIGAAKVVTNTSASVEVKPTAGSWSAYINGGNGAVTDVKVATYTVTISMSEITG